MESQGAWQDEHDAGVIVPPARITAGHLADPVVRHELEARSVRTVEEAAKALEQDGDEHHCPLCHDYFNGPQFTRHAAQCIENHTPKRNVWIPDNPLTTEEG